MANDYSDADPRWLDPKFARSQALRSGPTVDEALVAMGMDPNADRLSLMPRYSKKEGLVAPEWVESMARAAASPGVAAMGGEVSPEDAVNVGMNVMGGSVGAGAAAPVEGAVAGMGGRSTIRGAKRKAFPGIYEDPKVIAEKAAAQVAPESENLPRLFDVTRADLAKMADNPAETPGVIPGAAALRRK